jgi:YfiH family protein
VTPDWVMPEWPAPPGVRALSTTRAGGCSEGPWSSMNLGERCGDSEGHVRRNRERLTGLLPAVPQWLRQVHGTAIARHAGAPGPEPEADALVAFAPGRVCAVLTADCLPVVFCDRSASRVGVAHAGWRGLACGVLQATIDTLECDPGKLMAWLGPAIGPSVYEVGADVAAAFPDEFEQGFKPRGDRWLLDLYTVARLKLAAAGVEAVYGGGFCTYSDPGRFFSFRRDGVTGRMATLVWLEQP